MEDNFTVGYSLEKIEFLKKYKFTICGENMQFPGLVTEKIIHAFYSNTIPIYVGDPLIDRTFNKESFINAVDYSEDELIKKIRMLDENDDLYAEMLSKQKYATQDYFSNLMNDYEKFLLYIFNQNRKEAFRRQNDYFSKTYEEMISREEKDKKKRSSFMKKVRNRLKKIFVPK